MIMCYAPILIIFIHLWLHKYLVMNERSISTIQLTSLPFSLILECFLLSFIAVKKNVTCIASLEKEEKRSTKLQEM